MLHMSANSCLFTCLANTATFTLHLALFCSNMLLYSIAPKCSMMYLLFATDVYLIHCFIKISICTALRVKIRKIRLAIGGKTFYTLMNKSCLK